MSFNNYCFHVCCAEEAHHTATYLTAISTSVAGPSEYTPPLAFNNAIFLSPIRPTGPLAYI